MSIAISHMAVMPTKTPAYVAPTEPKPTPALALTRPPPTPTASVAEDAPAFLGGGGLGPKTPWSPDVNSNDQPADDSQTKLGGFLSTGTRSIPMGDYQQPTAAPAAAGLPWWAWLLIGYAAYKVLQ